MYVRPCMLLSFMGENELMNKLISLAGLFFLTGCSTVATVAWYPELSGATIIDQKTQNQFGSGPLILSYDYSGQVPDAQGCYKVSGVTAKWPSGAVNSTEPAIRICEGATSYQVTIPYNGTAEQRLIDANYAAAMDERARQAQIQQQHAAAQSNDHLWAAAILGVANVASAASNPTGGYKPAPATYVPAKTTQQAYAPQKVSSSSGCTSDYDCSPGKQCVKAPMQSNGQCLTPVNSFGLSNPANSLPRTQSILPNLNTQGQCNFNTDCPVGFQCDTKLKVCVK